MIFIGWINGKRKYFQNNSLFIWLLEKYVVFLHHQITIKHMTMTTIEIKNRIKSETGLNVSVKKGTGSMSGYVLFTTKKTEQFDYDYSRNLIKEFPSCDFKPAFANNSTHNRNWY
jgi:hypothetical protein